MKKIILTFLLFVPVIINAQEEIKIDSIKVNNLLDEVIVNAVRVSSDSPVTHSNLSKEEISKRNLGQDIPILMNYMPNVVTSSDAGAGVGYTYIRVRGTDASRVNVTVNGIPYNDAESQGTFWVNMGDFASSTESLQLQRGVGTSTNGSGAFGASLNLLTDAISEKANGEISNSFGSFGTRKHTVKFSTGKLSMYSEPSRSVEFAGRLSNIYSDGYVDRAFSDLKSYFLQGSYIDVNTLIKALAFGGKEQTYQAWFGLSADELKEDRRQNPYTYDNETDNYQQNHYQLHWNEKLNENWSTTLGLNFTHGEGYFEQFKSGKKPEDFADLVFATDGDRTDLIVRRWLENDFYVANFNANYTSENLKIISGVSYNNYTGDHFGEIIWAKQFANDASIRDRYYESDAVKKDFSTFSKATFNVVGKLKMYIDLQLRFVNYTTSGLTSDRNLIDVNTNFIFFNPKIGFTYIMNDNSNLYTSYSRANREPNRKDFELNINVKSEKLNDFELGWRLRTDNIKLNTNIYYMQYIDQLILTGDIDDTGDYTRENVDDSYRLGLEIDADIQLSDKISIRPNISLSTNKIKDFSINRDNATTVLGDSKIAFSPGIVAGNAFVYNPSDKLQLALLSKFVGEQYLSNTETEASKLDSYFTSDFNISYGLETNSVFKSIVFTGLINNVFNKEYVDRGYTYLDSWTGPASFEVQGYYPQATRNFLVGMTLKF